MRIKKKLKFKPADSYCLITVSIVKCYLKNVFTLVVEKDVPLFVTVREQVNMLRNHIDYAATNRNHSVQETIIMESNAG